MISIRNNLLATVPPLVISFLLSSNTLTSFFTMLAGGIILWIPYWLALWLSSGFTEGVDCSPGNYIPTVSSGVHPVTDQQCVILHTIGGQMYIE